MKIFGVEYGFRFSVGAAMEIAKYCPGEKLENLTDLMNEGSAKSIELICKLAEQCSIAFEQAKAFESGEAPRQHLTREMALSLEFGQMGELMKEVMAAFSADGKTTVELASEPAKKNEEDSRAEKSD